MAEEVAAISIRLEANINKLERSVQRAQRTLDRGARNMERRTDRLDRRLARMGSRFGTQLAARAAFAVGSILSVRKALTDMISAGDKIKLLEGRFKALTDSAARTADNVQATFDIAQRTSTPFENVGDALARFVLIGESIGATDDQLQAFTENLLKLGQISGSTTAEMSSALLQLSQGIGTGALRGEEFRAVFESMPIVIQRVADKMGLPIGAMKDMASQGAITGEIILDAIGGATDEISAQFAALPDTVERASVRMKNAWDRFLISLNKTHGVLDVIIETFDGLATQLDVERRFADREELDKLTQQFIDAQLKAGELQERIDNLNAAIDKTNALPGGLVSDDVIENVKTLESELQDVKRLIAELQNKRITLQIELDNSLRNPRALVEGPAGFIAEQERNTPFPPARPGSAGNPIDLGNEPAFFTPPKRSGGGGSKPDDQAAIDLLRSMTERIELLRLEAEQIGATNMEIVQGNAALDKKRALEELDRLAAEENTVVTQEQIDQAREHINTIERLTVANAQLEAAEDERLRKEENLKRTIDDVARSIEQAVFNAETFEDALKNLAIVLARTALTALQNSKGGGAGGIIAGLIGAFVGGASGGATKGTSTSVSAKGNVFSGGNVVPFARGGVVGGPTVFPMAKGVGLMGEAGPEAILPLKRGPGGRLGVEGGGGGNTVFIDATGADEAALARVEAKLAEALNPVRIKRVALAGVLDERRRNPKLFGPSGAR